MMRFLAVLLLVGGKCGGKDSGYTLPDGGTTGTTGTTTTTTTGTTTDVTTTETLACRVAWFRDDGQGVRELVVGAPDGAGASVVTTDTAFQSGTTAGVGLFPTHVDFSPDSTRLAFWVSGFTTTTGGGTDNASGLWVAEVEGGASTQVVTEYQDQEAALQWAPDGSRIAYAAAYAWNSRREVFTVPATGGSRSQLSDGTASRVELVGPGWSPDSSKVAFFQASDKYYTAPATGSPTAVPGTYTSHGDPAAPPTQWTRDGSKLIAVVAGPRIATLDVGSGAVVELGNGSRPARHPTDDRIAFFDGAQVGVMDADGSNRTMLDTFGRTGQVLWGPADNLYVCDRDQGLVSVALDGSGVSVLAAGRCDEQGFAVAPACF